MTGDSVLEVKRLNAVNQSSSFLMTISPRFGGRLHPDGDDQRVGVWYNNLARFGEVREALVSQMTRELADQGIVDLEKNLNLRVFLVDLQPYSIDIEPHGGLGNPRNRFPKGRLINPPEIIASVAKGILNVMLSADLFLDPILPLLNFRELTKIPGLSLFGIADREPESR